MAARTSPRDRWQSRFLTVDRIVPAALGVLIIVSWIGARLYVTAGGPQKDSPFVRVWAWYAQYGNDSLYVLVLLAVLVSLMPPFPGAMPIGVFLQSVRKSTQKSETVWAFLAILGPVVFFAAKGPYLWYAPAYLMFAMPQMVVSIANLLAPISLIAAGVLVRTKPLLGVSCASAMTLALFASATRLGAAVPLLVVMGMIAGAERTSRALLPSAVLMTPLLLPLPLALRSQGNHGFFPYADQLPAILTSGDYAQDILNAIVENVSFSTPLLSYTSEVRYISTREMLISLHPLGADEAGWVQIMPSMRVHEFIPFSMLGEFASLGNGALFLAVLIWALIVRACVTLPLRQATTASLAVSCGGLALGLLSVVYSVQYNTRSVSRIMTVLIITVVGYWFLTGLPTLVSGLVGRQNPDARTIADRRLDAPVELPR